MIPVFLYLLYTAFLFLYIFFSSTLEFYRNTGIKVNKRKNTNKLSENFTGIFTGIYRNNIHR
jgi:hypothetical protein